MDLNNDNLNIFQKQLDNDEETKSNFITASNEESDSDSESDSETEECKIVFPKHKQKKNDTSRELLYQLLQQNKQLIKARKKQYKLQSELHKEEVQSRYVKLELNNAHVVAEESKNKLKTTKKKLFRSQVENLIWRIIILIFLLYQLYSIGQYIYNSYTPITWNHTDKQSL